MVSEWVCGVEEEIKIGKGGDMDIDLVAVLDTGYS